MQKNIMVAKWWKSLDDKKVDCHLCPRRCVIASGKSGFCGVRRNVEGTLYSYAYARPVALQVDPIEKKPLAEFMSGSSTFSIGTYGCNLDCQFCQNNLLSRGRFEEAVAENYFPPERIVEMALEHECKSIAFTYNEPSIFAEYIIDIVALARKESLAAVLVSNGYITREAAEDLYPLIDAANIDMKGFSESFYQEMTNAHLQPVLDSIKFFYSLGKHLELTNLVIPGKNDDPSMIDDYLDWVDDNLDKDVPLHFSAYHPAHRYHESPRTPVETLSAIRTKAIGRGFQHVYLGNIW